MFRDPFFHEQMLIIVTTYPNSNHQLITNYNDGDSSVAIWKIKVLTLPLSPLYSPCKPTETGLVDLSLIQVAHGLLGRGHQYRPGDTEV